MDYKLPTTADEYMQCVRTLSALVDAELTKTEQSNAEQMLYRLPRIISMVNTIGHLRGQDNFFLDDRPSDVLPLFQKDLYALEDSMEGRLRAVIMKVMDAGLSDALRENLEKYYITARVY